MKTYYVMWTYIANYSSRPYEIKASSPQDAANNLKCSFSKDFARKGNIFVFDNPPSYVLFNKGVKDD